MKNKYKMLLLSAAAMSLSLAGCENELDITQKGVDLEKSVDVAYNTDAGAEAGLAKVYIDTQKNFAFLPETNGYNYGPYFAMTNFQADDIYLAGSGSDDCVPEREYHDFRFTADNNVVLGGYTALYRSIHKCNLVVTMVPGTTAVQKRCIAEARVMRAFDYLTLAIYWGDAPLVEEVLSADAQPVNAESQAFLLDWVVKEIDLALPDLDERQSTSDTKGAYKITKGFANAIKGKALLWAGKYNEAKAPLKAVITSGKYDLLPGTDMGRILHADGKGTCESVFELNYVFVPGATDGWQQALRTNCNAHMTFAWRAEQFKNLAGERVVNNGWGWLNPTGQFGRDLIANDGMNSYRRKAWIVTYDELLSDDGWWLKPAEGKGIAKGAVLACCEGFFNFKTCCHPNQGDISSDGRQTRNFPIMRYAEVLLLYAEACAQTGDNDGLQYLNMIQNRAGSAHVSSALTLDEVKKEKQFELWMEGCRSADIIRWGDTKGLEEADFYTPGFDENGQIVTNNGSYSATFYKDTYGSSLGFKKGKNEFLPFPLKVTDLNKGLKQHAGWN